MDGFKDKNKYLTNILIFSLCIFLTKSIFFFDIDQEYQ